MRKIKVVLGCGFGDEGKGQVTHAICENADSNSIVVRFSGGHQVGHTVTLKNGFRHTFSNFGSGTLLDIPTYWSKFCCINPTAWYNEWNLLVNNKITPKLMLHPLCQVTTPFDILANSKSYEHGSVGVGIFKTLERNKKNYNLFYKDLDNEFILRNKLELIMNYYIKEHNLDIYNEIRGLDGTLICWEEFTPAELWEHLEMENFIEHCEIMASHTSMSESVPERKEYICEGSQGILLDQYFGLFPHVTPSNTTDVNLRGIFGPIKDYELRHVFVTRGYVTRHGAGPIYDECGKFENPYETNLENEFQGKLRNGYLSMDMIDYAVNCCQIPSINKTMVVTCMDVNKNQGYTRGGKIITGVPIFGNMKSVHYTYTPSFDLKGI